MPTHVATTLASFSDRVREIRSRWKLANHKEIWFRGEDAKHVDTKLRPKLFRPSTGQGLKSILDLLVIENSFYEDFERYAGQLSNLVPHDDWEWEWYFLMQHHGVPTRILDWSDGSLIALHFALRSKQTVSSSEALVYVLNPYWLLKYLAKLEDRTNAKERWGLWLKSHKSTYSKSDWDRLYLPAGRAANKKWPPPETPVLWDSPHLERRVAAQRSRFMIFGTDPNWLSDFVNRTIDSDEAAPIQIISVKPEFISGIRQELRDAGVTESVIFPDLDGLGRELDQLWRDRAAKTT